MIMNMDKKTFWYALLYFVICTAIVSATILGFDWYKQKRIDECRDNFLDNISKASDNISTVHLEFTIQVLEQCINRYD